MKRIVLKPIITEKTMVLAGAGRYTFAVALSSEKPEIAANIAKHYGVQVEDVHTIHMHGKVRRVGRRRSEITHADWKKAIIRVKKGQTIEAFQPSSEPEQKK